MLGLRSEMGEHLGVVASCFLKSITQDWHAVEGPFVVDGLGERQDVRRQPSWVDRQRTKRVAEDVTHQISLDGQLGQFFWFFNRVPLVLFRLSEEVQGGERFTSPCGDSYSKISGSATADVVAHRLLRRLVCLPVALPLDDQARLFGPVWDWSWYREFPDTIEVGQDEKDRFPVS